MKDQFAPVRDNEECERIIRGTYQGVLAMSAGGEPYALPLNHYGHDDYQHGDDLLGRTRMIVVDVERMTARREYDEFKTDYWYWEKGR